MGGLVKVDIGHGRGWLAPEPAASLARIDAQLGRLADINEAGRSPEKADENYRKWLAYKNGSGPWAPYALPASKSVHCWGYAADSDDWYNAAAAAVWRENGWRQTARYSDDRDEPWHGEYSTSNDKNYGKEIPMSISSEDVKRIAAEVVRQISVAHIGNMIKAIYAAVRFGKKGVRTHGDLTAALMSEIGAQQIYRATHGQAEKIDVTALAAAISDELDPVDAEKLANAILKAQGKALTDATRS